MIRPILDDVYQPLVKQQEILSRQETVLKALRKTFNQCESIPWNGASLLRSTPFKKYVLFFLKKYINFSNL